jgi:hypothetical protein
MKSVHSGIRVLFVSLVLAGGAASVPAWMAGCTSGTTPDCDDGACGVVPEASADQASSDSSEDGSDSAAATTPEAGADHEAGTVGAGPDSSADGPVDGKADAEESGSNDAAKDG